MPRDERQQRKEALRVFKKGTPLTTVTASARGVATDWQSGLFDFDGAFRADLDAALATEALFSIHRYGFSVLHFEDLDRADVHALFAASAFFLIDGGIKSHQFISFR